MEFRQLFLCIKIRVNIKLSSFYMQKHMQQLVMHLVFTRFMMYIVKKDSFHEFLLMQFHLK